MNSIKPPEHDMETSSCQQHPPEAKLYPSNKTHQLGLHFAALLLCGGSLLCSVGLWVGEQQTLLAMILAGIFAVALELCKFLFFPVAARQFQQSKIIGALIYFLSLILLGVSIVATVAFLETGTQASINSSLSSSTTFQSLKINLANLQREIETLNLLMQQDLNLGYRQRSYAQLSKLAALRAEKKQANEQLLSFELTPQNGAHSLFEALAKQMDVTATQVRQAVYMLVAILVDVCGIVCLLLLALQGKKQPIVRDESSVQGFAATKNKVKQNAFFAVQQKIVRGVYGYKPVMRKIMKTEGLRYSEIKLIFSTLVADGALKKLGRRFALVGVVSD